MAHAVRRPKASHDPRSQPAYTLAEGARYLKLPQATLRSWVAGRPFPKARGGQGHSPALIHPARHAPPLLSFWNLIEAHVLRALRVDHSVSLKSLRSAIHYAEEKLGIERLLLSQELRTDAGRVFLERYGALIDLSASGQLAMRKLFAAHLARVEWDRWKFPVRLYPFLSADSSDAEPRIAIDPQIAFGRPVIQRVAVSTIAIAERIDAGESVAEVAADYEIEPSEVEQAVMYERSA